MRALLIDPAGVSIVEIDIPQTDHDIATQLNALRTLVGGHLEIGYRFPNGGDAVLIDEEGKLKEPRFFFWIRGCAEPFAGRGLVVGSEDANGDITPAISSVEGLRRNVRFSIGTTL